MVGKEILYEVKKWNFHASTGRLARYCNEYMIARVQLHTKFYPNHRVIFFISYFVLLRTKYLSMAITEYFEIPQTDIHKEMMLSRADAFVTQIQ